MAKIDREALARLRRVFDEGAQPPALLAEAIVEAYAERLSADEALLLERWMTASRWRLKSWGRMLILQP